MYYSLISSMQKLSDAEKFILAAGITDSTQKLAINNLVISLKSYGLWSKMKVIYPFVGGTASSHKFNLKDPRDMDIAYRVQFLGGWTHSLTGVLPNGNNAYGDTKLLGTILMQNSTHISSYSRTNNNIATPLISATNSISNLLNIWPRYTSSNDVYLRVNSAPTSPVTTSLTSLGLYIANRITSNETRNFIRNQLYIQSSTSSGLNSGYIYLSNQTSVYDSREQAFVSIGDGLTDTEASNLYTSVQAYQTTLGRQV